MKMEFDMLRRSRFLGQIPTMRSSILALACAMSILLAGCASRIEKRANENDARAAAMRWLQLLDDGDYAEAFEFTAQDFRMSQTHSQLVRLMQARRAPVR